MTDPSVNVATVWQKILDLGYVKTRIDRAEKGSSVIEVGYGASTIRVRLFKGTQFLQRWDIAARTDDAQDQVERILEQVQALGGAE